MLNPAHPVEQSNGLRPVTLRQLWWSALSLCVLVLPAAAQTGSQPELSSARTAKQAVTARTHMVVAAHPLAAKAGLEILEAGGSAVDAAIATELVLALVEPHASGLGGGGYALMWDARSRSLGALDFRETAPLEARPDLFLDAQGKPMKFLDAVIGGRSVGVPGLLRGIEAAHARHGRLGWARLFQPAIRLAENGFPMSARLHLHLGHDSVLRENPQARTIYFTREGQPQPVGAQLINRPFAAVLKRIAREGPDAFYHGPVAQAMVRAVRHHPTNPGTLSETDLANYRVRWVDPVCGRYREYSLCGPPPSSSGGIGVLQMLGLLQHTPITSLKPDDAQAAHLFAEAGRLVYADRDRYVADDRFVPVPTAGLVDAEYLAQRAAQIRARGGGPRAMAGTPPGTAGQRGDDASLDRPSTTHLSVVDRWGNAVSLTASIEAFLGSRLFVQGFLLNNELTDFSFLPGTAEAPVANSVQPGKRPRSTMAPLMAFDASGRLALVVGSPGGSHIINFVSKTVLAHLGWQLDIQQAINLPNLGNRNGATEVENLPETLKLTETLRNNGHEVKRVDLPSGVHAIAVQQGRLVGGADPRREGIAVGR